MTRPLLPFPQQPYLIQYNNLFPTEFCFIFFPLRFLINFFFVFFTVDVDLPRSSERVLAFFFFFFFFCERHSHGEQENEFLATRESRRFFLITKSSLNVYSPRFCSTRTDSRQRRYFKIGTDASTLSPGEFSNTPENVSKKLITVVPADSCSAILLTSYHGCWVENLTNEGAKYLR